jgi:hypothetical protein
MNSAWDNGTFWYSLTLSSLAGLFAIFDKEIQPRFTKTCVASLVVALNFAFKTKRLLVENEVRLRRKGENLKHVFADVLCK